jgi:hypothetical protein
MTQRAEEGMSSQYPGDIPGGWDRSDSAGGLYDMGTHAPIRNVQHDGGWIRHDGGAMPDAEHAMLRDQAYRQSMASPPLAQQPYGPQRRPSGGVIQSTPSTFAAPSSYTPPGRSNVSWESREGSWLAAILLVPAGLVLPAIFFGIWVWSNNLANTDHNPSGWTSLGYIAMWLCGVFGFLATFFIGLPLCLSAAWRQLPPVANRR